MKISTRKITIRLIAALYLLLGILGMIVIAFFDWHLYEEVITTPLTQILFILPTLLYLTTSFGLWTYRKWGRVLAVILSSIICLLLLYSFLPVANLKYLPVGIKMQNGGFIVLFGYIIILLTHKDTKLIFERRGNLERLDNPTPNSK